MNALNSFISTLTSSSYELSFFKTSISGSCSAPQICCNSSDSVITGRYSWETLTVKTILASAAINSHTIVFTVLSSATVNISGFTRFKLTNPLLNLSYVYLFSHSTLTCLSAFSLTQKTYSSNLIFLISFPLLISDSASICCMFCMCFIPYVLYFF